jgi:hypothetical protein
LAVRAFKSDSEVRLTDPKIQLLTYLAPLCPKVDLGTAAVILSWHNPLRVAENAARRGGSLPLSA